MLRWRLKHSESYARRVLHRPNSCITRSSWRISSWPFSKKAYDFPSLPLMLSFRGRCLELITLDVVSKDIILTMGCPLLYVPGTARSRFLALRSLGEQYVNSRV